MLFSWWWCYHAQELPSASKSCWGEVITSYAIDFSSAGFVSNASAMLARSDAEGLLSIFNTLTCYYSHASKRYRQNPPRASVLFEVRLVASPPASSAYRFLLCRFVRSHAHRSTLPLTLNRNFFKGNASICHFEYFLVDISPGRWSHLNVPWSLSLVSKPRK